MKRTNRTHYSKPIDAIVPIYDCNGNNGCNIIYSNGTSKTKCIGVDKCVKLCLQILRIDLYAHRMWAQDVLNRRNGNPIVINENMVFISVKMRNPVGSKDGSCGYVQLHSIDEILEGEIHLQSGVCLPCLYTRETMMEKMKDAKLLQYTYIDEKKMYDMIYGSGYKVLPD